MGIVNMALWELCFAFDWHFGLLYEIFSAKKHKRLDLLNNNGRGFSMSKRLKKIRLASTNGDLHFIYEKLCSSKWVIEKGDCDEFEAKKISRDEASKPLFLVRG